MNKKLLNLGRALNKTEQRFIKGGTSIIGEEDIDGEDDQKEDLYCYCGSGGVYKTGHCKWCGWFCGASQILGCR